MEHLRCVVERITYQNAQNGYSVIKCRVKGYSDLVTVVGSMPDVHVGSVLELGGSWRVDDGSESYISLNLRNLEYPAHSNIHVYALENLGKFWSYAENYLKEDE